MKSFKIRDVWYCQQTSHGILIRLTVCQTSSMLVSVHPVPWDEIVLHGTSHSGGMLVPTVHPSPVYHGLYGMAWYVHPIVHFTPSTLVPAVYCVLTQFIIIETNQILKLVRLYNNNPFIFEYLHDQQDFQWCKDMKAPNEKSLNGQNQFLLFSVLQISQFKIA